jgi:hypothetical protein
VHVRWLREPAEGNVFRIFLGSAWGDNISGSVTSGFIGCTVR